MRSPLGTLAALLIAFASFCGACSDSGGIPCPGGCPPRHVCDIEAGRCVEVRPPTPPDLGRYASLAVDSADRLVVAAWAARYGDLVLGRERDDSTFEWEYVDGLPPDPSIQDPDVGLYASLQLDALDRPHVAYFDRTSGRLKYAVRTGEGWNVVEVPQADDGEHVLGRGASLALDDDGLPRIAFLDEHTGSVLLARKLDSNRWQIEVVTACSPEQGFEGPLERETGRLISLVLDKRGGEWIALQDVCTGSLQLASRKPDGWALLELDRGPDAGNWVSAALDRDGNVALAYHDRSQGTLNYAWNQGGSMKTVVVDGGCEVNEIGAQRHWPVGQHCALAFGHDGLPRILYLHGRTLDLKVVLGDAQGAFSEPAVLDAEGPVGFFSSLALGLADLPAVSYRVARDEDGESDGTLAVYRLDSGAARMRSSR